MIDGMSYNETGDDVDNDDDDDFEWGNDITSKTQRRWLTISLYPTFLTNTRSGNEECLSNTLSSLSSSSTFQFVFVKS